MGLEAAVKESWENSFRRIFNLRQSEYREAMNAHISDISIEDVLLQLGHDDVIPLQDFRRAFEQVYLGCLLASLAYHGTNASQRWLAQRMGVSAPTIKKYESYYKLINTNGLGPQSLFFATLETVLQKDNRRALARTYGKLIMLMFPHYMRVIENEISGIPYLQAAFNSLYAQIETRYIEYVLQASGHNAALTATRLNIARPTLDNLFTQRGIAKRPCWLRGNAWRPGIKDKIIAYLRAHEYSMRETSNEFRIPVSRVRSIANDEIDKIRRQLLDSVKSGQLVSTAALTLGISANGAWALLEDERDAVREMEMRTIRNTLSSANNITQSAEYLRIAVDRMYKMRRKYGIA